MPTKSGKQYRLMAGIAHGMKPKIGGPSEAVAKEFVSKTPKKKRSKWSTTKSKIRAYESGKH